MLPWMWQLLAALFVVCALAAPCVAGGGPLVKTATGLLQGATAYGANQFLGVPYAQPPVGPLRWKRPQAPLAWIGIRQAVTFPNSCMQAVSTSIAQSEDCLYVNVFTPLNATSSSNLPVMYWIHGGGWEFGTPVDYAGNGLAAQYNVVIVTVAYRLGPLGYLAESHLLQAEPFLGSLGTMDQQAGLEWVQKNIAAFGGNPNRVTIFGESAGSGSVNIHLTMPSSKGLFHNVIGESGVFLYPTIAEVLPLGAALAAKLNCSNVADPASCLMAVPASEVMLALPINGDILLGFLNTSFGVHWSPAIDGVYFTGQPINLAFKGQLNAKNFILGTNGQEGNSFVFPIFNGTQPSRTMFEYYVNNTFGPMFLASAYTTYASDISSGNFIEALADMSNDFWFQCQRLLMAQATAAAGVPTYTYVFTYPWTQPGQPNMGAIHGDEVVFVWDYVAAFNLSASEAQLASWMSSAWAAFATTDSPNGAHLPVAWLARNTSAETPMNFNLELSVLPTAYRATYCPMWLPVLLAGSWPN